MRETIIGYSRCSTDEQDLTAQRQRLAELGVAAERIYFDHGLTGISRAPPGLDQALAAVMSGLDMHYDLGEGQPLLGRRVPELDLSTAADPLRVFTLPHDARPVLLNLREPGGLDITPWVQRVLAIDATFAGTSELPVLGQVAAPAAVLLRPDGYIAWVGDGTDTGLRDALTTWCGSP